MNSSDTTPVWKKIYQVVSAGTDNVGKDVIENILSLCKKKLIDGFINFKPYSNESFKQWKDEGKKSGLADIISDDEMCNFVNLLSKELDLEVNIAWTVICNFLIFEYYGKVDELKSIIRYDTNVRNFIDNIWYFYSADRMFLLKTLRHIFEFTYNKEHTFNIQFKNFVDSIDMELLWNNLKTIFERLVLEINNTSIKIMSKETVHHWVHRNNREQCEVIMLLIHTLQYIKLDGKELEEMLKIFMSHGFGRHHLYRDAISILKPKHLSEIKQAEIGLLLAIMNMYFKNPNVGKPLDKNVEKNMELLQIQGDNSIILFLWAVLKTSMPDCDDSLEYCNQVVCQLIKKQVFKSLNDLLKDQVFAKCKSGDIVTDAVFKLMTEFVKICADFNYLHEQQGVTSLTAELLQRKGPVVLDHLGPLFQLSMEAFPFVFTPFVEICTALISYPEHYKNILYLLKNIPGFLAEIPWTDVHSKFFTKGSQRLFVDSDLFIIPEGTVVERFCYGNMEYARFLHPFSFFLLMEQFIKSLSISYFGAGKKHLFQNNLIELVTLGFEFILHILKHYKGDFYEDRKNLIQSLEIIPLQFCEGNAKNFDFIRLYFKMNFTVVAFGLADFTETFHREIQRKIFPKVTNYKKIDEQLLFNHGSNGCLLFRSLKEEEAMSDHSLLVEYLLLIEYMVENKLYYQEVQIAGMWYILNVSFPVFQQWKYNDSYQFTLICKICLSIFIKVLHNHLKDGEERSVAYQVFEMCSDAFLLQDVVFNRFLSMFSKSKFYIQDLMENESNWIEGPVKNDLENIRLQFVLLLLLFKQRATIPLTTKCVIDDKISLITKGVVGHIVNPYLTSLRILSCRYLEVLARNENIPLMALLGLDYDQVQRLFLDRLRDPMEDDTFKLHILELISTCISHQHGMTAAFFDVTRSKRWYIGNKEKMIEGDTVTDFMIDYLHNINKSHEYLRSPLQKGILRVMANLWINGKHHLIKAITDLDAFWPLLADPFFQDYIQTPSIYSDILKIVSIQIGEPNQDKKFVNTIEKLLTNQKQLSLWKQYILELFQNGDDEQEHILEREELVNAWVEFIMMVDKHSTLKTFSNEKSKINFINMGLDGIQLNLVNMHCLKSWIEMCLVQICNWGLKFKDKSEDSAIVEKFIRMLAVIKTQYDNMNHTLRSAIITILQRVLKDLKEYLEVNSSEIIELLEHIGPLVDFEYSYIEENLQNKINTYSGAAGRELIIPWMLCIDIVNTLFKYENIEDFTVWFSFRNYLNKVLKSTCTFINNKNTLSFGKMTLRSLTLYIESPLTLDFLNVNMTRFYDVIEQTITALLADCGSKTSTLNLEEGWVITSLLMKFNTAYLKKLQYYALPSCYSFLMLYEQIIKNILFTVPETTVSLKALDLLLNTLVFFDYLLLNWQEEWYKKSNKSYNFVMIGVKKVINSCIYTILQPKNITIFSVDQQSQLNQVENIDMFLMVEIMNRLLRSAGICFSILYKVNPSLTNLLDLEIPDTSVIILENDFSVPKFELPIPTELTYGKLLCLAHFLCKCLDSANLKNTSPALNVPEESFYKFVGIVEHSGLKYNFQSQKLSSYFGYINSGLTDPWMEKLNYSHVKTSLDHLMVFLAQQVFLTIKARDKETLPYYRRSLCTELQFFYEYVRKQTAFLINENDSLMAKKDFSISLKGEKDSVKRYLLNCKINKEFDEYIEKNFCLGMYQWFTKICQIR